MKVVKIGSLFYGCIVDGDKIDVRTIGYPTYEMCLKMSKIDDI